MSFVNSTFKIKILINRYFPIPKYLSFEPVAIDMSPGTIRILKLTEKAEGVIPVFYKEIKLDDKYNLTKENITQKEIETFVSILKKLKQEYKLKYVVTSLPEQKTYIYKTRFPREALFDMVSAIRFNIEENVPLEVNDVNFDYKVIKYYDTEIEVIISVFPKSVVTTYTDILKKANLSPLSFQSESASIARAVVPKNETRPLLIVRILRSQINVAVVENEVVQYASKIPVKGRKILESVDSEEAKILSQELNKTLIYWFTNKKDTSDPHKIESAILVGKYALKEGLVEYLENSLKIDVSIGDVWANCFSTDDYIPKMSKEESLEYSSAIGLALKALKYK